MDEVGLQLTDMFSDWRRSNVYAAMATEEDLAEWIPHTVGDADEFEVRNGFKPTRQWARFKHADAMVRESRREDGDD